MTQERDDYMRRQEADHDLLRMRQPNYMAQIRAAGREEDAMRQRLIAQGWVWHDDVKEWRHPECPGTSISS